ncbi:MAG: amidohydrolase family protein [Caldimonas sp.]
MSQPASATGTGIIAGGDSVGAFRAVAFGDRPGRFDVTLAGERIVDIQPSADGAAPGWLALPAFVNFHAHADRAFTASGQRPGSLAEAVAAAKAARATASVQDIRARARRLFERSVAHGTAAIRTHTDVDAVTGMRAIEGVVAAAADMADAIDVEIVAFANAAADPADVGTRGLLAAAVRLGATVIGAVPAMCERPAASAAALLGLALDLDVAVDLHLDEHLDPGSTVVEHVVDATVERGLEGRVVISHACVLSRLDDSTLARIFEKMARARMILSVQPALNLYLQDRGAGSPRRRGLLPVLEALRAGVEVRFGSDNVRDAFFPFGDADPLDECYVAALATHLESTPRLLAATCGGRSGLAVGDVADVVLIPALSFDDALARRPSGRLLVRGCRIVRARPLNSGQ